MSADKTPTADYRKLVTKAALRVLDVEAVKADPAYQRDVKSGHRKIVADFNEEALGIPVVGERADGSLWVVDGYQRLTALKKLNRPKVRAEVFRSDGPEHEARIFKLINMNRTRLTPSEQFRALLAAQDETAWKIKETVEAAGFALILGGSGRSAKTSTETGSTYVNCVSTLQQICRTNGFDALTFALTAVKAAWPDDVLRTRDYIIHGLAVFWTRNEGVVDLDRLTPRLTKTTPHAVMYTASQAGNLSGHKAYAVADVIEKVYKKRYAK